VRLGSTPDANAIVSEMSIIPLHTSSREISELYITIEVNGFQVHEILVQIKLQGLEFKAENECKLN